ncbi:MAG: hypothetical protein U0935_07060 [Pirellulales bacterium]
MHETTRRLVCRAGFLLGCVLPTLAVLGWVGYLRSPMYREAERVAWCETLSRQLGVDVVIERVVHPEPRVTWLEGVTLGDPETGRPLASVSRVELGREEGGWVAFLAAADVPCEQLTRLIEVAHPIVWRRAGGAAPVWHLVIGSLQLSGGSAPHTLLDVEFHGQSSTAGNPDPQVRIEFRVAGVSMRQPAQVTITRLRHTDPPTTAWACDTGPQALPASLLAIAWSELGQLGDDCHVSGHWLWREETRGWSGEAQGRLTQVDLNRVVTDRFPHKLSGIADIVISRLRWEQNRLVDAAGSITSEGGVVSQSLMLAASQENALQWAVPERVTASRQTLWKYRQLGLGFELTAQGVQLTGQCATDNSGVILADVEGPLASEGREPWLPPVTLVRWLAPRSEIQVPASASTAGLLRWLPLPPLVSPEATIARPPYSPLKLQ